MSSRKLNEKFQYGNGVEILHAILEYEMSKLPWGPEPVYKVSDELITPTSEELDNFKVMFKFVPLNDKANLPVYTILMSGSGYTIECSEHMISPTRLKMQKKLVGICFKVSGYLYPEPPADPATEGHSADAG